MALACISRRRSRRWRWGGGEPRKQFNSCRDTKACSILLNGPYALRVGFLPTTIFALISIMESAKSDSEREGEGENGQREQAKSWWLTGHNCSCTRPRHAHGHTIRRLLHSPSGINHNYLADSLVTLSSSVSLFSLSLLLSRSAPLLVCICPIRFRVLFWAHSTEDVY